MHTTKLMSLPLCSVHYLCTTQLPYTHAHTRTHTHTQTKPIHTRVRAHTSTHLVQELHIQWSYICHLRPTCRRPCSWPGETSSLTSLGTAGLWSSWHSGLRWQDALSVHLNPHMWRYYSHSIGQCGPVCYGLPPGCEVWSASCTYTHYQTHISSLV